MTLIHCPLGYTAPRGRVMLGGMRHTAVLLRGCVLLAAALAALGGFILSVSTHVPFDTVFAESPSATSTLWASGYNYWGQLGDGANVDKHRPTQESTGETNWSAITAGWFHTVALKSDGTLWAWGNNEFGQLGDGTTAAARLLGLEPLKRTIPVQESTGATDWSAIASGGFQTGDEAYHTVALKSDGTLWGWGYNGNGQLGDGTTWNKDIPTQESTEATSWSAIAAGGWHTVALRSDGTLWAWGKNNYGQLGDGTVAEKHTPTQESTGATNWSAISAGFGRTVALKSDGTLWAWGKNDFGQLGDGTVAEKHTPTQESTGATNWSAISAGLSYTVALKSDGTLWAWGNGGNGQHGDGTTANKNSPTKIGATTNWSAIAAGGWHTVALRSDGTLWGSGSNYHGQFGDGTTAEKYIFVQETTAATNWSAISAGGYHTVAIKSESAPTPTPTPTATPTSTPTPTAMPTTTPSPTPTNTPTPMPTATPTPTSTPTPSPTPTPTATSTPTPTPIPATSSWGLAALAAALLAMTAILLRRPSGPRPATRP
jgi:alpha-tubulin suppressor-like RCC1 family protein